MSRTGVLVMAYGTPASLDQLEAYYTHIRRGRPPEPAQIAELRERYEAIGGISPLAARTEAQRSAVASSLDAIEGGRFHVVLGQKHAPPFIEDGAAELRRAGVDEVVGIVLAPHFSRGSVAQYHDRAAEALGDLPFLRIDSWHLLEGLVVFLAEALAQARADLPAAHRVLFSAHSLPERILADGDPYPDELTATAAAVAGRLGLDESTWGLAWQSAGRTPEPWRGPDILTVIDELAEGGTQEGVVVCPQGFTSDHLEVLYDLDIEARARAEARGLAFARTRSVNADPTVMDGLARLIAARAGVTGPPGA